MTAFLIDIDLLKGYLEITTGDEDDFLSTLVEAANAKAQSYCQRVFKSAPYTDEVYDGSGIEQLLVKNYPLTAVSAVKFGWTNPVTLDATIYKFESAGIITLINGGAFTASPRYWSVSYTAGYTDAAAPGDLKLALTELAAFFYRRKANQRIGMTSKSVGGQVTESYGDIPPDIKEVLDRYSRKEIFA